MRSVSFTLNGKPAAIINVTRQIGGNINSVSEGVKDVAFNQKNLIPSTLHLSTVYDLAEFVQESMASVRDAIIIGSGMSGLTAAIILAKEGKRVVVLEEHYRPGGFLASFNKPQISLPLVLGSNQIGPLSAPASKSQPQEASTETLTPTSLPTSENTRPHHEM